MIYFERKLLYQRTSFLYIPKPFYTINVVKKLSTKEKDDIIINEIKRISGRKNAKVELHYEIPNDIEDFGFDYEHINKERNHKITHEEALSFIRNSKMRMTVWQGIYENYYSDECVSYVHTKNKIIRTAYKKEEFDDKIKKYLEVLNREEW